MLQNNTVNPGSLLDDDELVATIDRYQIVIIDRAERLHPDTLAWLVSPNDKIATAILLVARKEVFEKTALDAGVLTKGRKIDIREFTLLAVDLLNL